MKKIGWLSVIGHLQAKSGYVRLRIVGSVGNARQDGVEQCLRLDEYLGSVVFVETTLLVVDCWRMVETKS